MGGNQSYFRKNDATFDRQDSYSSVDYINICNAEDVLIDILSFVPFKDLLYNCRLVSKQWKAIIDGQSVWKRKCERKNIEVSKCKLEQIPDNYYQYIYLHEMCKGNLITNPCGEGKFDNWELVDAGGDGFRVENPSEGADAVPVEVGSQSCFATSYHKCRKYQVIDLYKNKVNKYLLKNNVAKIRCGEWYAARFDCACKYELTIVLLDSVQNKIDKFYFQAIEEQWNGREWHLVSHEFPINGTNVRYVHFEHAGKDLQFWAGHYGSKFTGSFVELCLK